MSYLECAKEIYAKIRETNFRKLIGTASKDYHKISAVIEEEFNLGKLRTAYAQEMQLVVNKYLPFYKDKFELILKTEEVKLYLVAIPTRTLLYLFWIWEKKLVFSDEQFNKIVESIFLGTFGYKMIDYGIDYNNSNSETSLIGFYSIRVSEDLLSDVFGIENTKGPIRKYFTQYVEIELFEKNNRWKDSPFDWNNPILLGQKGAPIAIYYESLLNKAGYNENRISEMMEALCCNSAAIQLIDDLMDIKIDLSNGYETLVVKDYYKTFGTKSEVTDEKIHQILTEDRLKLIFSTCQRLFDRSRNILEKYDEYIFQYQLEMQNLIFNSLFEIT